MGKHGSVHSRPQGLIKFLPRVLPVEQLPPRHLNLRAQGMKGPGHRVVFKAGYHHPAPRSDQRADGDVQAVGAVHGENHLLRPAAKQFRRRFPAAVDLLGSGHGRAVASPAGIGAGGHGPGHCPADGGGLREGGRTIVQINHISSSSNCPSSICKYTRRSGTFPCRSSSTAGVISFAQTRRA